MIRQISTCLKLPVVITQYKNKNDYFNRFIKKYETGPKEFPHLVDHASFVVTSSFHGTAFSILYEKPFFALDGMADRRISSLLKLTGLEEQSVTSVDLEKKLTKHDRINFTRANEKLIVERQRSLTYLKEALGL